MASALRSRGSSARWRRRAASLALAAGVLVAALLVAFSAPALGREALPAAADAALEARMLAIAAELRCLVCQNQSLADSNAALAADLRQQMRSLLRAGARDDAVRSFMTERYGDVVLYRPPLRAATAALWFGPFVLLAIGLCALVLVLRQRRRGGADRFEPAFDVDTEVGVATHLSRP